MDDEQLGASGGCAAMEPLLKRWRGGEAAVGDDRIEKKAAGALR
jgi:hypothetical protein